MPCTLVEKLILVRGFFQMVDFCSDPMKILTILEDMTKLVECEQCELSSIFDEM